MIGKKFLPKPVRRAVLRQKLRRHRLGEPTSPRWFGIPRWLAVSGLVGLALCYLSFGRDRPEPEVLSDRARTIIEGLQDSSVYVEPDAPGKVDAELTKRLVGDRPIVVAILDERPVPVIDQSSADIGLSQRYELCDEVAGELSTNLVIIFGADEESYDSNICIGDEFSNATNPVDAGNFDLGLIVAAETAWKYRVTEDDLTPVVEEFVYAFDAQAAEDYPNGTPRRAVIQPPPPAPSPLQTWQIVLSLAGIMLATVVVFLLLRLLGKVLRQRMGNTAAIEHRKLAASTRLSELAGRMLHAGRPRDAEQATRQARAARQYVHLLHRFDGADSADELAVVERELRELQSMLEKAQ